MVLPCLQLREYSKTVKVSRFETCPESNFRSLITSHKIRRVADWNLHEIHMLFHSNLSFTIKTLWSNQETVLVDYYWDLARQWLTNNFFNSVTIIYTVHTFLLRVCICLFVCMCICVCTNHGPWVEVKRQLAQLSSFLPWCESQLSDSRPQAWQQTPLCTEPPSSQACLLL